MEKHWHNPKRRKLLKRILCAFPALSFLPLACEQQEDESIILLQNSLEGMTFVPGEILKIIWTGKTNKFLNIEFSQDGGNSWKILGQNIPNDMGFFDWTVIEAKSSNCKIRITLQDHGLKIFTHPGCFSITSGFTVDLNQHNTLFTVPSLITYSHKLKGSLAIRRLSNSLFVVHSMVCTHNSCELFPQEAGYDCRCHGSSFDKKGCVLNGPAILPLTSFRNSFDSQSDILKVFLEPIVPECK